MDAAFPEGARITGLGMCLRDDTGAVRMARTCWHPIKLEVKEGEALGLFEAIQWTISLNLSNVIFEVDSKVVVDNVKSNVLDAIEFGTIIEDCRRLFSLEKNSWTPVYPVPLTQHPPVWHFFLTQPTDSESRSFSL